MPQLRLKHRVPPDVDLIFRPRQVSKDRDGKVIAVYGRCLRKGSVERRIIASETFDGREIQLHATKGFRNRRA